jgi:hypothetical protein
MSPSSDTALTITIAIISFIGGIYLISTGVLALAKRGIKISGFYQLGAFIYTLLYSKANLANFEKEMLNPKKAVSYGLFCSLRGGVAFVDGTD